MTDRQWQFLEETIQGMSVDEKVELIQRISRSIEPVGYTQLISAAEVFQQVAAIARLPLESAHDGFSGDDHDRALYGRE